MMAKDKRDLLKMMCGDIDGLESLWSVTPSLMDSILSWILEDRMYQRRLPRLKKLGRGKARGTDGKRLRNVRKA